MKRAGIGYLDNLQQGKAEMAFPTWTGGKIRKEYTTWNQNRLLNYAAICDLLFLFFPG